VHDNKGASREEKQRNAFAKNLVETQYTQGVYPLSIASGYCVIFLSRRTKGGREASEREIFARMYPDIKLRH
jgi:hypothetical protein